MGGGIRAGGGFEEHEGSWKPVLYFSFSFCLLHILVRITGKLNDPCGSPQIPNRWQESSTG
jgi:hypothetical protein